jgi:hypothetical protein
MVLIADLENKVLEIASIVWGDKMVMLNESRRIIAEYLSTQINEMILGYDGSLPTTEDGGIGQQALTLVPTVTLVDDGLLLVEGTLTKAHVFTKTLQEVVLQNRNASTSKVTPLFRYTFNPFEKNTTNEVKLSFTVEVR